MYHLCGLPCNGSITVRRVVIVKIRIIRCKSVSIICMQTLHSHLPGLCATVGRAQKRQVGYSQPTVAIGLPVGRRTVKGCGITRLPACSIIVRTNKTTQIDGLLWHGTGRDHQILQPGQRNAVTLGQAASSTPPAAALRWKFNAPPLIFGSHSIATLSTAA